MHDGDDDYCDYYCFACLLCFALLCFACCACFACFACLSTCLNMRGNVTGSRCSVQVNFFYSSPSLHRHAQSQQLCSFLPTYNTINNIGTMWTWSFVRPTARLCSLYQQETHCLSEIMKVEAATAFCGTCCKQLFCTALMHNQCREECREQMHLKNKPKIPPLHCSSIPPCFKWGCSKSANFLHDFCVFVCMVCMVFLTCQPNCTLHSLQAA